MYYILDILLFFNSANKNVLTKLNKNNFTLEIKEKYILPKVIAFNIYIYGTHFRSIYILGTYNINFIYPKI